MRIYALSDLHIAYEENLHSLADLHNHPDDWLLLGGDIGEREEHLRFILEWAGLRFARIFWIPGNHDLWTIGAGGLRGEEKYLRLVKICRDYGALTPEDPFAAVPDADPPLLIAPLLVLYDYSFRPGDVTLPGARKWAAEKGISCNDEIYLHTDPHRNIIDWCRSRVEYSERRLREALQKNPRATFLLLNHYPLFYEHAFLRRIPRFSLWCGTRITEEWTKRFPIRIVVYGHLHIPRTHYHNGVRYEEVSLGYPGQWPVRKGINSRLRQVWPEER